MSDIPVLLVGCQNDLRADTKVIERMRREGEAPVSVVEVSGITPNEPIRLLMVCIGQEYGEENQRSLLS